MHDCCGFGPFPCGLISSLHVRSVVVVVRRVAGRFASEGAAPDGRGPRQLATLQKHSPSSLHFYSVWWKRFYSSYYIHNT